MFGGRDSEIQRIRRGDSKLERFMGGDSRGEIQRQRIGGGISEL